MKVINLLLIIIFILGTLLGIKVYNSNKEPKYSVQYIQQLLEKANDIKNYECELNKEQSNVRFYKRKGNKVCLEYYANEGKTQSQFYDYDLNTSIFCSDDGRDKFYIEKETNNDYIPSVNSYIGLSAENFFDSTNKVKILSAKEENINGNKCLKVKFKTTQTVGGSWLDTSDTKEISVKINVWINIENGLIMKISSNQYSKSVEFNYKFNSVTEADVNPDLSNYKKIETNNAIIH